MHDKPNISFLALVCLVLAMGFGWSAHASTDTVRADIAGMAWLGGCWKGEGAEEGSGEHWMPLAGGTLLGVSRTVRGGRTAGFEFMELRTLEDGRIAFIAHPSGQATTTFPLLRMSETEAVFENPDHDFPQRIAYAKAGDSGLRARIEGLRGGSLRVIEFAMERVSCDMLSGRQAQ